MHQRPLVLLGISLLNAVFNDDPENDANLIFALVNEWLQVHGYDQVDAMFLKNIIDWYPTGRPLEDIPLLIIPTGWRGGSNYIPVIVRIQLTPNTGIYRENEPIVMQVTAWADRTSVDTALFTFPLVWE